MCVGKYYFYITLNSSQTSTFLMTVYTSHCFCIVIFVLNLENFGNLVWYFSILTKHFLTRTLFCYWLILWQWVFDKQRKVDKVFTRNLVDVIFVSSKFYVIKKSISLLSRTLTLSSKLKKKIWTRQKYIQKSIVTYFKLFVL